MSTAEVHKQISAEEIAHTFEDEAPKGADLSQYAVEDWLALAIFWIMALCVFLQFFTRYVLNDSYAWTEEIATYCLIGVVFIGYAIKLVWQFIQIIGDERMTTIKFQKGFVYYAVLLGFAMMFVRSIQIAVENWRRGYSILERPGAFDGTEG